MSSHGGGNSRLDDQLAQLAEPGFPAIDDHGMGRQPLVQRFPAS